jgi:DNA-binding NarL/FixJ family response regulator
VRRDLAPYSRQLMSDERTESTLHVLVVEDNDLYRAYLTMLLTDYGRMSVVSACTLKEAQDALCLAMPNAVVLDLKLPDSEGLSTLVTVRAFAPKSTAVVVLSGTGDELTAVEALRAGASEYLTKLQSSPTTIIRTVQRAVQQTRAFQELHDAIRAIRSSV